jgi:hypothetical protein
MEAEVSWLNNGIPSRASCPLIPAGLNLFGTGTASCLETSPRLQRKTHRLEKFNIESIYEAIYLQTYAGLLASRYAWLGKAWSLGRVSLYLG